MQPEQNVLRKLKNAVNTIINLTHYEFCNEHLLHIIKNYIAEYEILETNINKYCKGCMQECCDELAFQKIDVCGETISLLKFFIV